MYSRQSFIDAKLEQQVKFDLCLYLHPKQIFLKSSYSDFYNVSIQSLCYFIRKYCNELRTLNHATLENIRIDER